MGRLTIAHLMKAVILCAAACATMMPLLKAMSRSAMSASSVLVASEFGLFLIPVVWLVLAPLLFRGREQRVFTLGLMCFEILLMATGVAFIVCSYVHQAWLANLASSDDLGRLLSMIIMFLAVLALLVWVEVCLVRMLRAVLRNGSGRLVAGEPSKRPLRIESE